MLSFHSIIREKVRAAFERILEQRRLSMIREKIKDMLKRIPEQLKRLSIVFAIIVIGVLVVRYYIVPPSLVETRLHRESTMQREISKEIKFAGATVCGNCHGEEYETKRRVFIKTYPVKHVMDLQ